LELGGGRGEIQRSVVPLVSERRVEASERKTEAVAEGRDRGDVEAMQADFRIQRFRPELLDAPTGARTSEGRIEPVAVPVAVTLDFQAGARREPGRERLV